MKKFYVLGILLVSLCFTGCSNNHANQNQEQDSNQTQKETTVTENEEKQGEADEEMPAMQQIMTGKITEKSDDSITIESELDDRAKENMTEEDIKNFESNPDARTFVILVSNLKDFDLDKLNIGDRVEVEYDGAVTASLPPQITNPSSIKVLNK